MQRRGHKKIVWITKKKPLRTSCLTQCKQIHTMQQHRNEEASLEVLEQKLHIMQMEKQEAQKVQWLLKKPPQQTTKIKNPLK